MNLKALTQPPATTTIFFAMAFAGLYVGDNWTRIVMLAAAAAAAVVSLVRIKKQQTTTSGAASAATSMQPGQPGTR